MAKKNPEERPSVADAIKVTGFKQFYLKFICLKSHLSELNIKILIYFF